MTTEDDFQRALDASPDDWQTRLVFADWLQERDDPRAEGYRAIGMLRRVPVDPTSNPKFTRWQYHGFCSVANEERCDTAARQREQDAATIPEDWYDKWVPDEKSKLTKITRWITYATRREAEDAAALAFAKLPEARRMELLSGPEHVGPPRPDGA